MKTIKLATLVAASLFLVKGALAAQTLEYTILKEGEPIGFEKVSITEEADRTSVDVETKTDVKLLFLKFSYHHKRNEVWQGDQLVAMSTETNDDGTHHRYELKRQDDHLALKVNGEDSTADAKAFPLSLWSKAVLDRDVLLSVIDAQPYKVKTEKLGENHYRLDGDIARELWFSNDGYLEKVAFKRKGFLIEFKRK